MFYLFWFILNVVLSIALIYYAFKAFSYLKPRFGSIISLIFVFGLLSFIGGSGKRSGSNSIKPTEFYPVNSIENNSTKNISVILEQNRISSYKLMIWYGKDKYSGKIVPVSAWALLLGVSGCTDWSPMMINAKTTLDESALEYEVYGTLKWKLLNIEIYAEPKHWKGVVQIN
jgi:hypothetical protein